MVLPYQGDAVPEGWLLFDGRVLDEALYPDLWELLHGAGKGIKRYWELMGGTFEDDLIILPNTDSEQAAKLMHWPKSTDGLTLAIKAKGTVISDDAGNTSEIHSSNPDQG